jgi:hypothetical protein
MNIRLMGCIVLLALGSCTSLKQPHERFITNMNTTVAYGATIKELGRYSRFAMKRYLNQIEDLNDVEKYHYKKPMLPGGYCYYHFVIDKQTRKVIGWAFDAHLGDPRMCGNSG